VFQSRSSNLVDDKLTKFGCQLNPGVVMVWLDDNPASVNDQVAADVQQAQLMEQCSSSFKKKIRREQKRRSFSNVPRSDLCCCHCSSSAPNYHRDSLLEELWYGTERLPW
jgi:hypothetical protein